MKPRRMPETVASPPDDGGHRGSFTVPTDVMDVTDGDLPAPAPDLASDTTHRRDQPQRGGLAVALVMLMLVIGVMSWLIYGSRL